jgi:hypothetical protein
MYRHSTVDCQHNIDTTPVDSPNLAAALPFPVLLCTTCNGTPPLCDSCVEQTLSWHLGTAALRGELWADRVRTQLGRHVPPWPPFEGKALAIALRLVGGLDRDERVNEALAERCWAVARRRWEKDDRGS